VWIAGGGSGHGFKMGPALGEVIADAMIGGPVPDAWRLARFGAGGAAWPEKWS
jgi:glycine/D-amino acid oxidase-like deaminating enzyme